MDIANKLVAAAENVDKVYEAGKEAAGDEFYDKGYGEGYEAGYDKAESVNPLYYANTLNFTFSNMEFEEENSEIICKVLKTGSWNSAFITTSGIKTLKIIYDTQDLSVNFQALVRQSADLELLDLSEFKCYPTTISYFVYQAKNLVSILGALDLSQCTNVTSAFAAANALENIEFVPNTIPISISFSACTKLTHDSLMSIINGLAVVVTTQTLTLGTTNLAKLTDEEKAIATEKGWSLA